MRRSFPSPTMPICRKQLISAQKLGAKHSSPASAQSTAVVLTGAIQGKAAALEASKEEKNCRLSAELEGYTQNSLNTDSYRMIRWHWGHSYHRISCHSLVCFRRTLLPVSGRSSTNVVQELENLRSSNGHVEPNYLLQRLCSAFGEGFIPFDNVFPAREFSGSHCHSWAQGNLTTLSNCELKTLTKHLKR